MNLIGKTGRKTVGSSKKNLNAVQFSVFCQNFIELNWVWLPLGIEFDSLFLNWFIFLTLLIMLYDSFPFVKNVFSYTPPKLNLQPNNCNSHHKKHHFSKLPTIFLANRNIFPNPKRNGQCQNHISFQWGKYIYILIISKSSPSRIFTVHSITQSCTVQLLFGSKFHTVFAIANPNSRIKNQNNALLHQSSTPETQIRHSLSHRKNLNLLNRNLNFIINDLKK